MPKYIGIGYKKQVGKSTLANFLASRLGHLECKITPFASPLKQLARSTYGLTWDETEGDLKDSPCLLTNLDLPSWVSEWGDKNKGGIHTQYCIKPRDLLQDLGVTMRKAIPGIWVNAPFRHKWHESVKYIIIPDVRFEDELKALKRHKGILIKVNRKLAPVGDTHESETALDGYDDWDIKVDNDGSLKDLDNEARVIKEFIKESVGTKVG